ncbi:hypothetical protein T05_1596 [Trichinella murrelli]|uniref:Uncharacterized protein n=1 Tax=Trichinella murrelli TaxID=144512 RepID=A0A0V0T5X6_9BILA|nr:hypothetical protein T05_1596 [Trichinella murrelli]
MYKFKSCGCYKRTSLNVLQEVGPTIHTNLLEALLRTGNPNPRRGRRRMWISLEGRGSRGLHVLTYNGVFRDNLLPFFSREHRYGERTTPPSFSTASGREAGRPTVGVDGVPGVPSAQVGWDAIGRRWKFIGNAEYHLTLFSLGA